MNMVMLQNGWKESWNYMKVNETYSCAKNYRNYRDINYVYFNILAYQLLIIKATNIH